MKSEPRHPRTSDEGRSSALSSAYRGMDRSESIWTGIIEFGERLVRGTFEHRMSTYAAALAYRGLFGLFPFVLILVLLASVLGSPDSFDRLIKEAESQSSQQVPQQLQPVVEQGKEQIQPLEEIVDQAQRQAGGELLLLGVALALWSISALARTLTDAFNTIYGVTETRRRWKVMALSLASGPILALAVIVAMALMLIGPQVLERISEVVGLQDLYVLLWGWLRFPVALALLGGALSIVYRYGPDARLRFGSVALGAALAVLAWAVASVGFSIYLANFADYGVTYGSLGAAVGMLVYFYLSASIVLVGAELNAAIRPPVAEKTVLTEKPDLDHAIPNTQDRRIKDA